MCLLCNISIPWKNLYSKCPQICLWRAPLYQITHSYIISSRFYLNKQVFCNLFYNENKEINSKWALHYTYNVLSMVLLLLKSLLTSFINIFSIIYNFFKVLSHKTDVYNVFYNENKENNSKWALHYTYNVLPMVLLLFQSLFRQLWFI